MTLTCAIDGCNIHDLLRNGLMKMNCVPCHTLCSAHVLSWIHVLSYDDVDGGGDDDAQDLCSDFYFSLDVCVCLMIDTCDVFDECISHPLILVESEHHCM